MLCAGAFQCRESRNPPQSRKCRSADPRRSLLGLLRCEQARLCDPTQFDSVKRLACRSAFVPHADLQFDSASRMAAFASYRPETSIPLPASHCWFAPNSDHCGLVAKSQYRTSLVQGV
jgi:hypothetical protein